MKKMKKCKVCGADIAANAKVCPTCGAKNQKPVYKRIWFWLLIVFVLIMVIAVSSSGESENGGVSETDSTTPKVSTIDSSYSGDCGISASASMGDSIIGMPELSISIRNTSGKDIEAVKFYAVPVDVYGEEINDWTRQDHLYTDNKIPAGGSTSIQYQFIEDSVKTVNLYVYSVYYSDGIEWGNRDATESEILKNGRQIEVN